MGRPCSAAGAADITAAVATAHHGEPPAASATAAPKSEGLRSSARQYKAMAATTSSCAHPGSMALYDAETTRALYTFHETAHEPPTGRGAETAAEAQRAIYVTAQCGFFTDTVEHLTACPEGTLLYGPLHPIAPTASKRRRHGDRGDFAVVLPYNMLPPHMSCTNCGTQIDGVRYNAGTQRVVCTSSTCACGRVDPNDVNTELLRDDKGGVPLVACTKNCASPFGVWPGTGVLESQYAAVAVEGICKLLVQVDHDWKNVHPGISIYADAGVGKPFVTGPAIARLLEPAPTVVAAKTAALTVLLKLPAYNSSTAHAALDAATTLQARLLYLLDNPADANNPAVPFPELLEGITTTPIPKLNGADRPLQQEVALLILRTIDDIDAHLGDLTERVFTTPISPPVTGKQEEMNLLFKLTVRLALDLVRDPQNYVPW